MNITPYGKQVRKYRIDAEVKLSEMAKALGVSPAYLSAVEMGRKPPTPSVVNGSINYFLKLEVDASDLVELADRSRESINVSHLNENDRMAAAAFARKLPEIQNKTQLKELLDHLLNNEE